MRKRVHLVSVIAAAWAWGPAAVAQSELKVNRLADPPRAPAWLVEGEESEGEEGEGRRRELAEAERELKRIRWKHIRNIRNPELRQAGISKLREYDDPALYSTLFEVFEGEGEDVQTAILDMLVDGENEDADTALAWAAVFHEEEAIRDEAEKRLSLRVDALGDVPMRVQSVIALGLKGEADSAAGEAAQLADRFDLVQAIPAMINAQIQGTSARAGSTGRQGDGALAFIQIAQQVSFVSDLQPIVGDSAVGFDPTLSVVSEGVVLSVQDAVVVTYRTIVNNALISLSSRHFGRPTAGLGWDRKAWMNWYEQEFLPRWNAGDLPLAADDPTPAPVRPNLVPEVRTESVGTVIGEPAGGLRSSEPGRRQRCPAYPEDG